MIKLTPEMIGCAIRQMELIHMTNCGTTAFNSMLADKLNEQLGQQAAAPKSTPENSDWCGECGRGWTWVDPKQQAAAPGVEQMRDALALVLKGIRSRHIKDQTIITGDKTEAFSNIIVAALAVAPPPVHRQAGVGGVPNNHANNDPASPNSPTSKVGD